MTTWRTERLGWRDERLSERHGHWGFNCPAVDIDFLLVEYNTGKTCALIEYKHKNTSPPNVQHASYRAIVDLADGYRHRALPCLIAIYDPDTWAFKVIPLNEAGIRHYAHCQNQWITEQRFVRSLYLMRKAVLEEQDEAVIRTLNTTPQPST